MNYYRATSHVTWFNGENDDVSRTAFFLNYLTGLAREEFIIIKLSVNSKTKLLIIFMRYHWFKMFYALVLRIHANIRTYSQIQHNTNYTGI